MLGKGGDAICEQKNEVYLFHAKGISRIYKKDGGLEIVGEKFGGTTRNS